MLLILADSIMQGKHTNLAWVCPAVLVPLDDLCNSRTSRFQPYCHFEGGNDEKSSVSALRIPPRFYRQHDKS